MKTNLLFICALLVFSCCKEKNNSPKNVDVKNYNVIIVPDLSNRIDSKIHPKPLHDTVLINSIFDSINYFLKIGNRKTNQLDQYKVDFINRSVLNSNIVDASNLKIDFEQFKNKQLNASEYKRNKLLTDVKTVKSNVSKIYQYSLNNPVGADLWNYFNATIHNSYSYIKPEYIKSQDGYDIKRETKNIVVLFTDGYIENANQANGYNLTPKQIDKIRNDYKKSQNTDLRSFISSHKEYHIKKTDESLKDLNILVVEMVDRSLNKNSVAKYHPTDFQIMRIIWELWLKESGSENVEIYQAFSNKKEMIITLEKFMSKL